MAAGVMVVFAIACHTAPAALVAVFTGDPAVIAIGREYLRIISWNYVASGLIFVASSMFQAMGNTIPSLVASGIRVILIVVPALLLSRVAGFQLNWIWYIAVAAVFIQFTIAMLFLRREFASRLSFAPAAGGSAS
jgi:Na+-driven multidrug efflux pump